MSELIKNRNERSDIRWRLLTSASILTLLVPIHNANASDKDADHPTVWVELGGQLERLSGQGNELAPAFFAANSDSPAFKPLSPLEAEKAPIFSYGGELHISFTPEDTDWVFSAALRYGRANSNKHVHQNTYSHRSKYAAPHTANGVHYPGTHIPKTAPLQQYLDSVARHEESHTILDFQAGRDLGLGMFSHKGTSIVELGVRIAQFSSATDVAMHARPNLYVYNLVPPAIGYNPLYRFRNYAATGKISRDFQGIGPSISWDASAPFAGSPETSEFTFDWGANAAVLFGRQKTRAQHQTTSQQFYMKYHNGHPAKYSPLYPSPKGGDARRARTVIVPNIGGFAGVSLKFPNAKLSIGYRGDFFFGAIDGGIDAAKRETRGFYGPFATIGVGLGG